jgi:hypothetical protein
MEPPKLECPLKCFVPRYAAAVSKLLCKELNRRGRSIQGTEA